MAAQDLTFSVHPDPTTDRPTLDDLFQEYDNWKDTCDRDSDDFGALTKLTALYKFTITHYNDAGADLLREAIRTIEAIDQ